MSILFTGHRGFIGSHLFDSLKSTFDVIFPPDYYISPTLDLSEALSKAETLIHLGWSGYPASDSPNSYETSLYQYRCAYNLFSQAVNSNLRHIIFFSSGGTVYSGSSHARSEEAQLAPISPYGIFKLTTEFSLSALCQNSNSHYTNLRVSNPYGPRSSLSRSQGIINHLFDSAINQSPFTLWSPLETTRDYLELDDLSLVVQHILHNPTTYYDQTLNVGTGVGTSISDLIQIITSICGKAPNLSVDFRSLPIPDSNILDISKLKSLYSDFNPLPLNLGLSKLYSFQYLK